MRCWTLAAIGGLAVAHIASAQRADENAVIREIQIDEVPTPQYAQAMVITAERRYAGGSTPMEESA
jgi:hypothetical protein